MGFPLKDLLTKAKEVAQNSESQLSKGGSKQDECNCCVQNVNFIVGEKSLLVAGNGKTGTNESPKTEIEIPKQEALSYSGNGQTGIQRRTPADAVAQEDQLVVTSHPNQQYPQLKC